MPYFLLADELIVFFYAKARCLVENIGVRLELDVGGYWRMLVFFFLMESLTLDVECWSLVVSVGVLWCLMVDDCSMGIILTAGDHWCMLMFDREFL